MGMTNAEAREHLKDILCDVPNDKCIDWIMALNTAIKALEQTRWIPVSERLPQDEQKVLVTTRSGNLIDVDTSIFYHASAFWEHYVIAWMPLPEPYKAESEANTDEN